MGPPPAKRRRKLVVVSSEDEEEEISKHERGNEQRSKIQNAKDHDIRVLPTRLRSKHRPAVTKAPPVAPTHSITQLLPKKPAEKSHNHHKDPRSSSLDTYFSAAKHSNAVKDSGSQTSILSTAVEEEDFIEDDSFGEELQKLPDPRKEFLDRPLHASVRPQPLRERTSSRTLLSGSQAFRKLGHGITKASKREEVVKAHEDDTRPWSDRHGPVSLEELAVHKKKVADVRGWLQSVFEGRSKKKVLILRGASGVGKTATVSALSKAMGFDLLEWANPTVSEFTSDSYISTSALFEEFLRRSGKFISLDVTGSESTIAPTSTPSTQLTDSEGRRKVILVEEFPNMFMSSTNAIQSLRSSILRYLSTSPIPPSISYTTSSPKDPPIPLILILTENQTTSTTSLTDTLTAHRLLGPSILNHPFIDIIEFNPIAPTFITKALNLIIQKEARHSGRRRVLSPSVLKRLSEFGDVRSAIGSLEFLCVKGQNGENESSGRVAAKGKKGAQTAKPLTATEDDSLELVTQREASLGLFHAVGKVVYNKRDGIGSENKPPRNPPTQPPDHLPQHARLKGPDVAVDDLIDEKGTDTVTFVAALHENYLLSCQGETFLDTLNACVEFLSDSDTLISGRGGMKSRGGNGYGNGTFQGVGTDSIRQDEIAFHVAVRGLLFGLPYPVKRNGVPFSSSGTAVGRMKGKGDAFKMFYPSSMRLGRRMQEVEEGVERCMMAIRNPLASSEGGSEDGVRADEVASWGRRTMNIGRGEDDEVDTLGVGACGMPAKDDMVRDLLPYLAMIERQRTGSRLLEDVDAITKLTGKVVQIGGEEEEVDELDTMPLIDRKTGGHPSSKPSRRFKVNASFAEGSAMAVEQAVGKLYLSDDDIED
ncbi:MAG: hypothetical protein Q9209_005100 [Squamulea sp. 1 TL-2023]